ncbi:hypothetical protein PGTUg99_007881 [Puccinia graminis f. sp. tritici]|uniref:Uncharacterized protein n=1 Tax=Puccinia graminis f. sp. tritici TaxID=56615 RepID=A0A5B0RH34_PUCGR|nr:hypothetical protein PGTUg99_007881 [Puccinia graminis f. sp. tritici]
MLASLEDSTQQAQSSYVTFAKTGTPISSTIRPRLNIPPSSFNRQTTASQASIHTPSTVETPSTSPVRIFPKRVSSPSSQQIDHHAFHRPNSHNRSHAWGALLSGNALDVDPSGRPRMAHICLRPFRYTLASPRQQMWKPRVSPGAHWNPAGPGPTVLQTLFSSISLDPTQCMPLQLQGLQLNLNPLKS